jgi:Rrf2 family iron-sulfur cluster assembly transcriptional regulator
VVIVKISSKARYAIQAMFQLATSQKERPLTLHEITREQAISPSYLEQLLARLRQHGLVVGLRGPGGGYRLAKPANEITIAEIVVAIDDSRVSRLREDDLSRRDDRSRYHAMWLDLCDQVEDFLDTLTLEEFVENHALYGGLSDDAPLAGSAYTQAQRQVY